MIGAELQQTTRLPGPAIKTCPKCSQELPLYTHAQARTVVCEKCERLFEIREKGLLTVKHFEREKTAGLIPLGTKGRLNEINYQVVGFILYQERESTARWREYVLFNPVSGYAFLSEYNGHWNYFQYIADFTPGDGNFSSLRYQDQTFDLFHKYGSKVIYAAGEFSWNISFGSPHHAEYISPPYILTRSRTEKESSWLLGEYQEPEVIKEAFKLEKPMPDRVDIGSTEVFSGDLPFSKIKKITAWAAGLLLLLQICLSLFSTEEMIAEASFDLRDTPTSMEPKPIVGPTFTLNSGFLHSSNLEFRLSAPVVNDWFAAGITLLNTKTGQEFDFDLGVEYYSGFEGGESWSEGSTQTDQVLSALPDGEYQMLIRPFKSETATAGTFYIAVLKNVTLWSNFWIILLLLGIFPALQYYRERNFEKRRWMNSDYSPYEE